MPDDWKKALGADEDEAPRRGSTMSFCDELGISPGHIVVRTVDGKTDFMFWKYSLKHAVPGKDEAEANRWKMRAITKGLARPGEVFVMHTSKVPPGSVYPDPAAVERERLAREAEEKRAAAARLAEEEALAEDFAAPEPGEKDEIAERKRIAEAAEAAERESRGGLWGLGL